MWSATACRVSPKVCRTAVAPDHRSPAPEARHNLARRGSGGYAARKNAERRRCDTSLALTPRPPRKLAPRTLYFSSFSTNFKAAELIQNRNPVGSGPSSNTCPKCASHLLQTASVRVIPWLVSRFISTLSAATGW
jgi:hypothetical protein